MKHYKTIIIGGGMSGLACAKRLNEENKDFLLISKDLGGRMRCSDDYSVPYGAAYGTYKYKNILKIADKEERLRFREVYFVHDTGVNNVFSLPYIKYYWKFIKLGLRVFHFGIHSSRFLKQGATKSIKECIEEDRVLNKYWHMPAKDFIKKYKLEEIDEKFINPMCEATFFTKSSNINTLSYLGIMFPAIYKTWSFDFTHTIEKLTKGINHQIKSGEVTKVKRLEDSLFEVDSTIGNFTTNNIVFAAPQKSLEDVYNLPESPIQEDCYVFHIRGERLDRYKNKKVLLFNPKTEKINAMWQFKSGDEIIYTSHADPDFSKYFNYHKIIKKIYWDPAMVFSANNLIDQNYEKNVYLASSFNFSCLEKAFLAGTYAANQIIKTK